METMSIDDQISTDRTTYEEAHKGAASYLESRLAETDDRLDENFDIPVIDLAPSYSTALSDRQAVAGQIRRACTTSGFFYIANHGVSEHTRTVILEQSKRFYDVLSIDQKKELHIEKSKLGLGWEPSEYTSIAGDQECKEGFNFAYEAALDPTGGDGLYRNLDGTDYNGNMWPKKEDLPHFYEAVKEYYGAVLGLARHLFRLFALSLDLTETYFDHMTTHPGGIARLLYYPPPKSPQPSLEKPSIEEQIGLGAHSDYECFTLLHTSSTPGLEILKPSGRWHVASAEPGTFIVNIADFMMRWTNGLYKSTIHRVVNRSTEARYSVPFFFSVNYDTVVETLSTCLKDGEVSKWKPIRAGEYILERLNATTKNGYGFVGNDAIHSMANDVPIEV